MKNLKTVKFWNVGGRSPAQYLDVAHRCRSRLKKIKNKKTHRVISVGLSKLSCS